MLKFKGCDAYSYHGQKPPHFEVPCLAVCAAQVCCLVRSGQLHNATGSCGKQTLLVCRIFFNDCYAMQYAQGVDKMSILFNLISPRRLARIQPGSFLHVLRLRVLHAHDGHSACRASKGCETTMS